MSDTLKKSVEEARDEAKAKEYQELVKEMEPKKPIFKNICWAFVVGGLICAFGQLIANFLTKFVQMGKDESVVYTLVILIFLSALATGLGLYDKLGKHAGAGSIVPITGFANSVVAPAMEWRREGFIQGLAAKMFTLAGPVIVYGIGFASLLGLIKYLFTLYQMGGF